MNLLNIFKIQIKIISTLKYNYINKINKELISSIQITINSLLRSIQDYNKYYIYQKIKLKITWISIFYRKVKYNLLNFFGNIILWIRKSIII
jgi:hypothetical protein